MTNYCWWTGTLSDRYSLASVLIWSEDMIKVCLHLYLALLPKAWQPQDMDISHLFCKMQLIIVPNGGGGGLERSQLESMMRNCTNLYQDRSLQAQLYYQFEKIKKLSVLQFHRWKTLFLLCENNGIKLLNTNPVWIRIHNSGWNVVQPTSWFECCWYYCVALTRAKSCWATWRRCTSPPAGTSSGPFSGSSRYYYWIAKW